MRHRTRHRDSLRRIPLWTVLSWLIAAPLLGSAPVSADEPALAARQTGVAQRYEMLEELLLRLAEVEAAENPQRAALLRRAARRSRDQFVLQRLRSASEALEKEQFQDAVDSQTSAAEDLRSILKLLLSEDRAKRIREEKQRISEAIEQLKRVERAQRSTRARTENGAEMKELEAEQRSISDRAEQLQQELSGEDALQPMPRSRDAQGSPEGADSAEDGQPAQGSPPSDDRPGDPEQPEAEESDEPQPEQGEDARSEEPGSDQPPAKEQSPQEQSGKPADPSESPGQQPRQGQPQQGQPQQGQPQQGQPQQGQPQQGQPQQGQPQQGQPQQGQPQQGQPQQGQPQQGQPQPQSPQQQAQQRLQQAIERMRQAEQELKRTERDEATEQQRAAEENLRAAIDRLERILRQLREEEMQRELARLESRLRKMAAMQSSVLDDTVELSATPESQRNRQTDLQAGGLAFEEKKITAEADRALLLLREEGSSVAFPEVVSQIRSDTVEITERLGETKIDAITQGIQQDILAALEEMIAALQKAQRDLEKKRQQQQQGQPQPPQGGGEPPLVESLAELKLIRTMEQRIKSTTERYSALVESGESSGEEVLPLLRDLAERQNRLYQITRDLVLKRNQ